MVSPRATAAVRVGTPLLFLSLALVLTLLFYRSFPIDSDEGYTLGAAWQLWNGSRMYDDFRLFVGPGSGYAVFGLWKLLGGASHSGARLLAVGFAFSSTIALYLLLRRTGVRALTLAFTVVGWLFLSSLYVPLNHNSFSSYATMWFLLPFLRLVEPPPQAADGRDPIANLALAGLAGLAAGAAFLFLPTKGALLAGAAAVYLAARGLRARAFRPALALLGAFAAVVAPLALRWRPAALIRQWLIIPVTGNYLGHTAASDHFAVAAVVLVAGMGWASIRLRDRLLEALAVVQLALFASSSHNMELNHFAINVFPALIFVSVAVHRLRWRPSRFPEISPAAALAAVTATVVAWCALSPAGAQYLSASTWQVDVMGHRQKGFSSPRIAAARAIYAGPFLPGLYYLLGKKNPFFVSETVVCDDACQRRLVAEIEAVRPELAFLNYALVDHLNYDRNAPVDAFLRGRYVPCAGSGNFVVRASEARFCP